MKVEKENGLMVTITMMKADYTEIKKFIIDSKRRLPKGAEKIIKLKGVDKELKIQFKKMIRRRRIK